MLRNTGLHTRHWILLALAAVIALGLIAPAATASAQTSATAYVTAYYLNVRTGPSPDYARVITVARNQGLSLLGRNATSTWVQVAASGYQGWVNARYIWTDYPIVNLPVTDGSAVQPVAYVTAYFLNVRSGAGPDYPRLATVARDQAMTPVGRNAEATWVQVQVAGVTGWVNARYVTMNVAISGLPITWAALPAPQPGQRTHVVQYGDTLYSIARWYGVSLNALAAANGIANYDLLYAGQVLVIP